MASARWMLYAGEFEVKCRWRRERRDREREGERAMMPRGQAMFQQSTHPFFVHYCMSQHEWATTTMSTHGRSPRWE